MSSSVDNKEMNMIHRFAGDLPRHPRQINGLFEADAEIIKVSDDPPEYLILKTDGIHEEITKKLYDDPYLIGWMAITAPLSDIAATGATPTGVLLSLVMMQHCNTDWLRRFKSGLNDACRAYDTYVLGGDTSYDDRFSVSVTAVATLKSLLPMMRRGIKPGHYLYASGPLGLGNVYAYAKYFDTSVKVEYQPMAKLAESMTIRQFATACMDTSDGLFPALAVLSELNNVGFNLCPLENCLHEKSSKIANPGRLPAWMLLAGPHGEYELIFTIPGHLKNEFEQSCRNKNWQPLYLGEVISEKKLAFSSESIQVQCNPSTIANLYFEADGNITTYFELLTRQHKTWTKTENL